MGLVGRTISSADAINSVSLVITNDTATYLLKRPQDFDPADLPRSSIWPSAAIWSPGTGAAGSRSTTGGPLRRGAGLQLQHQQVVAYAKGGTYLLPVNDLTALYINALLETFDETMALFILDERANFRPAGIGRFARSKGSHLEDNLSAGRAGTVQVLETAIMEGVAIEQGMMIQNIGLMAQALGLGGFANFAPHPSSWFEALGFRMGSMPASRYLGASRLILVGAGRAGPRTGPLLTRWGWSGPARCCSSPSAHPTTRRWRPQCTLWSRRSLERRASFAAACSGWRNPSAASAGIPGPSEKAISATCGLLRVHLRARPPLPRLLRASSARSWATRLHTSTRTSTIAFTGPKP